MTRPAACLSCGAPITDPATGLPPIAQDAFAVASRGDLLAQAVLDIHRATAGFQVDDMAAHETRLEQIERITQKVLKQLGHAL